MLVRCPLLFLFLERILPSGRIVGYGHPGAGSGATAFFHTFLVDGESIAVVFLSNGSNGFDVKPTLEEWLQGSYKNFL